MTSAPLKEQALLLGPRQSLVGILTPPAKGVPPRDVTVLMLNSGIIHRVGANRLHVELARELAQAGFRVLRFDLSGVGDSPERIPHSGSLLGDAMADIRDAVDHVAGDNGRVVLFGLCSGAGHSLVYAPTDERVMGLILVDLWIPTTTGYHLRRMWRRLSGRRGWEKLMNGRHPLVLRALGSLRTKFGAARDSASAARSAVAEADVAPSMSAEEGRALLAGAFRPLIARKVPILAAFTAGLEDQHNYPRQLFDAFPEIDFGDFVVPEWFPNPDHTFSSMSNRRRLRGLVVDWMSQLRPAPSLTSEQRTTLLVSLAGAAVSTIAGHLEPLIQAF